jgi:plastocyanin
MTLTRGACRAGLLGPPAVALALTLASGAGAAPGARLASTAVGVGEREFHINVYRPVVAPGALRLNVTNHGEDVHDLAVVDRRGRQVAASGEIGAGARATIRVTLLRAGTYRLLCTRDDHAARGMRANLRVVRPRRPAR